MQTNENKNLYKKTQIHTNTIKLFTAFGFSVKTVNNKKHLRPKKNRSKFLNLGRKFVDFHARVLPGRRFWSGSVPVNLVERPRGSETLRRSLTTR